MRKIITMAVAILTLAQLSFANTNKFIVNTDIAPIYQARKVHPIENIMKARKPEKNRRGNYEKLLVLLIDFQEDDNPETTGNGKFNLNDTSSYPIPLDSPPRDYVYFSSQLQALQQYYKTVSYGSYNLQYDVFPTNESDINAYTLPHEMAYYNPGTQDQELMVERFEEYFHDAFTVADLDENINFGDYGHYMIIHAGSDWQHDRNGDSPHDIPSFFIQVGDGKEVVVDDGATTITYACNIPETITQDVREEGGVPINYGVINSVMVHEFGHSLGFVDLYNVSDYSPGVGYFDIMDAGGSVIIQMGFNIDGEIKPFYLEGINPIFPGAFSRVIAFEDFYRASGMMKDISELPFDQEIRLLPIGKEYDLDKLAENEIFILKIPINETEYVLIENRQIDPDGDGGTVPIGSLASPMGNRVVVGPSSTSPTDNNFNFEYDYLLPGWSKIVNNFQRFYGGGLLAWHVDEKLLYKNNNFTNNSVNTNRFHRAVKIIEADGIQDISNPYSHFWQGTAYEYFFKYQPIIDERNFFQGWDDKYQVNPDGSIDFVGEIAADELSAKTNPPLISNLGVPSLYKIYDISSYDVNYHAPNSDFEGRVMTFKIGTNLFDNTEVIKFPTEIKYLGNVTESYGLNTIPILTDQINLFSKTFDNWAENFGNSPYLSENPDFPITSYQVDDYTKYVMTTGNKLYIYDGTNLETKEFPSSISANPLYVPSIDNLVIATENSLFIGEQEINISAEKLTFDGNKIVAVTQNQIAIISPDGDIEQRFDWEHYSEIFEPIVYDDVDDNKDAIFIQNNLGEIWKLQNEKLEKIFTLSAYGTEQPTNMAIAEILSDSQPYLIFAAGDRVFAITMNGTLAPDFPGYLEDKHFTAGGFPKVVKMDDKIICYMPTSAGYLAVNNEGDFLPEYSLGWASDETNDQLFWMESDETLNFAYSTGKSLLIASKPDISENPIYWSGYRNNGLGKYNGEIKEFVSDEKMEIYVFPNPVKNGLARIRVKNAKANIKMSIYDVAGNELFDKEFSNENNLYQDLIWECKEIASGIYFAIIKSDDQIEKLSIAIVK
jgi:M6 family metalloprotease-like protein